MDTIVSKKKEFLKRLKASKEMKRNHISQLVEDMKKRYEENTGLKANCVEIW